MRYYISYPDDKKDTSWKDIVRRISRSL